MHKPYLIISIILFSFSLQFVRAQKRITYKEYITTYKDIAIEKMQEYKIPASITLAQGILESGSGNSKLARRANNHFGIKCHKGWKGKTYKMDDDEKNECFRKYKSPEESYHDHSIFLTQRDRYSGLFDLEITDYKAWARGLKKAGYATNPRYPQLLIKIIKENSLYIYDTKKPGKDAVTQLEITEELVDNTKVLLKTVEIKGTFSEKAPDNRDVYENNRVKYIIAKEGDTFESIADMFNIYTFQVHKYNELEKGDEVTPGQPVYIERKRNRHKKKYHIAGEGETMYYISQLYAVKLKKLYKKNDMKKGMEPLVGQKVKLK